MGTRRSEKPTAVQKIGRWVRSTSVRDKVIMGTLAGFISLLFLTLFFRDYKYYYFIPSRAAHALGLLVLIYKLSISKTCAGLSLKTQELTAIYLVARLSCTVLIYWDSNTLLDFVTLSATLWMIYMMRVKLKSSYLKELDTMPLYYVMVEPFTAHYVFALGVSRFFQCAYWIIQIIETKGGYLMLVGSGHFWILLALLSEVVQTFILADFCYYYVKSVMAGRLMRLPSMV